MDTEQLKSWNQTIIEEFRANGGKVGGHFEGSSMLLLTTMGAKSGKERVNPLAYSRDGDRYVIIGSYRGAPNHPDWYHNIQAQQDVTIEVGTDKFRVRATITEGSERQRLFDQAAAAMPVFNEYQAKTERQIPVITLEQLQSC